MARLTHKQRRVAHHIISVGRKKGASRKEILSALATALTEANLENPNYGDKDSVGWRQERSHYGSVGKRLNVRGAASRYFNETRALRGRGLSAAALSQAVQRSAYPGRYTTRIGQAKAVLAAVGKGGGGRVRGGGGGRPGTPAKFTPGKVTTDWDSAILESLMAGASGRRRGGLLQDVMAKVDTGAYTTKTDPKVTPGVPARQEAAGGGSGGGGGGSGFAIVDRALRMGVAWDRKKVAYLWGGGHGRIAKPGQPVDCSGFVSAAVGLKTPQVSGWFARNWGKPGVGRHLTVWANDGHVLLSVRDPRSGKVRWFGTSRSNPGGGAGEIAPPGKAYLRRFTPRHPGRR